MTKTEKNAAIYARLMESRRRNPKSYGLSSMAVAYEEVRNYARSEKCDRTELAAMASGLTMRLKELAALYALTGAEVRAYFEGHKYCLTF